MLKDEKVREAAEEAAKATVPIDSPTYTAEKWFIARDAALHALSTTPVQAEASEAEIKRLRGLLIDPGDPAWEDMRGILVAELRKAELLDHAASVAAGGGSYIPSWIALNLMATIAKTQAEASTLPGELDTSELEWWMGDAANILASSGNATHAAKVREAQAALTRARTAAPPTTPAVESGEVDAKYAHMGPDQRANAMADDCAGDPWELLGYFREKLKQSEWETDHARSAATDLAKNLALRASEQDVERVARAIMHAPTRNAKFSDFIHDDEAQSAARAALAAINGETT